MLQMETMLRSRAQAERAEEIPISLTPGASNIHLKAEGNSHGSSAECSEPSQSSILARARKAEAVMRAFLAWDIKADIQRLEQGFEVDAQGKLLKVLSSSVYTGDQRD